MELIEKKTFEKNNFTVEPLPKGEFENCKFKNCDFSNQDLSEFQFTDCEFITCNLSMVKLSRTALRNIQFKECKMLGLHFENVNPFGLAFSFDICNLSHSCFYKLKMKKTVFKNSRMHEVDFSETDLHNSVFDNCDLLNAKFDNTILEKSDLKTAFNFSIDPDRNKIKQARFSTVGIAGLLDKYDIKIEH